jgi:glycosyltransferase involved in cell wall biosynthesis
MRVALVRGPNLNPWELSNFELVEGVCAFGSRAPLQAVDRMGTPVRRLPSPADLLSPLPPLVRGGVFRFLGSVDYLVGLERALHGYDIAHVAELANAYSLQAIRARRRGACKRVVATVWQNIAAPATDGPSYRRVRAVANGLDRCVAITDDARLHLELAGVPADRIDVLPMGIDLDRFVPRGARFGGGPLRIVSVSRLVPEKGVEDLIVGTRLLADRGVDVQLTLAGAGPLEVRLRSLASELRVADRVSLTGSLPYDRIPALLNGSDVFVLASAPRAAWREQFGFAVVEAMASGLPVLAGDSGSLDEVVGDPAALVKPHDPVELADRLEQLAADPALRQARGAANRARAEERYDRRIAARRLRDVYEHALSSPARD